MKYRVKMVRRNDESKYYVQSKAYWFTMWRTHQSHQENYTDVTYTDRSFSSFDAASGYIDEEIKRKNKNIQYIDYFEYPKEIVK